MVLYVPGTEETDPKKQNMSLQQLGGATTALQTSVAANTTNTATNTTNIAANTTNIASNTTNIATNTTNIATNTASIAAINAAWSTNTPTLSAATGSFTSATASLRYKTNGKTCFFSLVVNITTNGTAAGNVQVSLPFTIGANDATASGRATLVSGKMLQALAPSGGSSLVIWNQDNTYPGANGERLVISGSCEIA